MYFDILCSVLLCSALLSQGLYIYGMELEPDTCRALLAAVSGGWPALTTLEFEYTDDEDGTMAKEFRNVISSRAAPMKILMLDP